MSDQLTRPVLAGFDPFSSEFRVDPFLTWARSHAEAPVFFYEDMNFWVLTRFDDVMAAVTDHATFSSRAIGTVPVPAELTDRVPSNFFHDSFVAIDPPEHTVSRKAANRGFTRPRIAALEPAIRAIANARVDTFIADGECDLMTQFCYPVSLLTIVEVLGLPPEDIAHFRAWTEDMFALLSPQPQTDEEGAYEGPLKPMPEQERYERWGRMAEAIAYYQALIDDRRARPREDAITAMVNAKDDAGGPAMSDERIVTHIQELIAAGNDTTANLMGAIMLYLAEEPEQLAELKADHSLMERAIEEGLRRRGSSVGMFRITTRDVVVGDAEIPEGSLVFLGFQAAGHDPEHFPDPRRFDLHRANASEHLSFGRGRHFCLGAPLARLEARVALETLLQRIPGIEVVADQELEFLPTMTVSALEHLRVRWSDA